MLAARRRIAALAAGTLALGTAYGGMAVAPASAGVSGAIFTTNVDGSLVNQNFYDFKTDVYLNGGPQNSSANRLAVGDYFFAVLSSGGQHDPNDGGENNLSDGPTGDDAVSRTFHANEDGTVAPLVGLSTHSFTTAGTVQLAGFDDTSNPGGVYIVAVCMYSPTSDTDPTAERVDPRDCKYDAFHVQGSTDNTAKVRSVFSGTKWLDGNANGVADPTDGLLDGWQISISNGATLLATLTTGASGMGGEGLWTYTTPEQEEGSTGTTTYTICETPQDGWRQTGPATTDGVIADAGVTVALSGAAGDQCYDVNVPNGANAVASDLDFFNLPQGEVSGEKYYDSNRAGTLTSQPGIQGWRVSISLSNGTFVKNLYTNPDGSFSTSLDPGTYIVREVQSGNGWVQTGNISNQSSVSRYSGATDPGTLVALTNKVYTVTVPGDAPSTINGLYFGNVCTATPGGHTLGYWANKGSTVVGGDLGALSGLNLVDAKGTAYDPPNVKSLSSWLLNATASNMAYMLSAQLAATQLSVLHNITNSSVIVDGSRDVAAEIKYASALLAAPITSGPFINQNGNVTVASSDLRTEQARVKTILDRVNNGLSFDQADGTLCTISFPSI